MSSTLIYGTILVDFTGHRFEAILGTAANPGGVVSLQADGQYDALTQAVAEALKDELILVLEDHNNSNLRGGTVDDAYEAGDHAKLGIPNPGDRVLALVASGEDVNVGSNLVPQGGGSQLFEVAAGTEARYKLKALEDTGGALAANALVLCRVI